MKFLREFSRYLVGLVFIFSGFVKGVDPLGTTYKIEDYLIAYSMDWAIPFALYLAVILVTVEFLLGIALFFRLRIKLSSVLVLLMMIFFTILTFFDAIFNPVPDCGCFGDAITLTNWETFYKNIVIMVFVLIIFKSRIKYKQRLSPLLQQLVLMYFGVCFIFFSIYNYKHLPMIDFMDWKIGKDMVPENQGKEKIYLTYANKSTGEEKEYLSPNYPWQDSIWMSQWEFQSQRIDDSEVVRSHELAIENEFGEDVTDNFIPNPDLQFLFIAYDLSKTNKKAFQKMADFAKKADYDGYSFIVLTSDIPELVEQFKYNMNLDMEFYNSDDIVLKTMVRANPGLMLLRDGVVLDKWHYNDLPEYSEIIDLYENIEN
ncbi:MAG: DoxX family protein [Bacteroidales bacterium]|nr:DoxX family protein [Bacteroidales bacterium]